MHRFTFRLAAGTLLTTLVVACGDDVSVPVRDAKEMSAQSLATPSSMSRVAASPAPGVAQDASGAGTQIKGDAQAPAVAPSMIIRNGSASVLVDSLELAIAAVHRMATTFGGYVGNTSLSSGENEVRSATIELKIPAARYDSALAGLKPIGKVESVSSTAEDVGEEFVDITARAANARRLEERLITLLATRTGKLEDVLAVERELARVREEIERYEGRLRYLKTRAAVSTLSVTVHERAPLVSASPGENVILEAFKDAWRNFVRFVAGTISMLGVIIPMLAIAFLLFAASRWWRRKG